MRPLLWAVMAGLLALSASSAVAPAVAECSPAQEIPPRCVVTFNEVLVDNPLGLEGLAGEVGTGGVLYWCIRVDQQAVANRVESGGSVATDPVRARIMGTCPFLA